MQISHSGNASAIASTCSIVEVPEYFPVKTASFLVLMTSQPLDPRATLPAGPGDGPQAISSAWVAHADGSPASFRITAPIIAR